MSSTQISAHISDETKAQMERYAGAHGLKKGALLEQALLHHLQALRELPTDIIIPPRIELTPDAISQLAERIANPRPPTDAMRELMASTDAED